MTCEDTREHLTGMARSDLEPERAARVQEHVQSCPECRAQLDTLTLAARWEAPDPPAGLQPRILAALEQEKARPHPWWQALLLGLERLAAARPTPLTTMASLVVGVFLFALVLAPNVQRSRSEGELSACRHNLRLIGSELEEYARGHRGSYPAGLGELGSGLPECPASGPGTYHYQRSEDGRRFTLSCSGQHETPPSLSK
ncbi:MAG: zf-HC2 domain-containing protein [Candidatus Eremiobacterota bacterium]